VQVHAGSQTFCLLGNLDEGDEMGQMFSAPTLKDGGSMPTSCRSLGEALGNMDKAPPITTPTSEVTVNQIELTIFS
jgi:hypothetical protein